MKKLIALIISVFFANALSAAPVVSAIQTDETSFFSIPAGETIGTYRSFHAEIFEDGTPEDVNLQVGSGDFLPDSFFDVIPNWTVNTEYDFNLSYNQIGAGNLELIVNGVGMTDSLTYQPIDDINQIFIANDNDAGGSAEGMELTNMVFESGIDDIVLPDLITTSQSFKGLSVSEFGNSWKLSGTINFTSEFGIAHNSGFKFYGVTVPEPSTAALIGLISFLFVLLRKKIRV